VGGGGGGGEAEGEVLAGAEAVSEHLVVVLSYQQVYTLFSQLFVWINNYKTKKNNCISNSISS